MYLTKKMGIRWLWLCVLFLFLFVSPVYGETKEFSDAPSNIEVNSARPVPAWLELNSENLSGKVIRLASREDLDIPVEEHLIVELYSK